MVLPRAKLAIARLMLLSQLYHMLDPLQYPYIPGDQVLYLALPGSLANRVSNHIGTFVCYQPHLFAHLAADVYFPGLADRYGYPLLACSLPGLFLWERTPLTEVPFLL